MPKQPVKSKGICKLCGRMEKLCNSHILPEFLYKDVYDQNPKRFDVISTEPSVRNRFEQKGIRERMLCEECEGKLSKHEDHARRVIFGGREISNQEKLEQVILGKTDYRNFKLFLLSILWRAGVARHKDFDQVELGHHEGILRRMILDGNPGEPHQYGCLISRFLCEGKPLAGFIHTPEEISLRGHTCYRFIFAGHMWVFFLSSHQSDHKLVEAFLSKSGNLTTIPLESKHSERFLANLARECEEQGKL